MVLSLDKFRAKLVLQILYAQSQQQVTLFVYTAITALKTQQVNLDIIIRVIDRVLNQLVNTAFLKKDLLQLNNINAAKASLMEMRSTISPVKG